VLRVRPARCLRRWDRRSGCSLCEEACPTGAIKLGPGGPAVGEADCVACGACQGVCPTGVFELVGLEAELLRAAGEAREDGRPLRVTCREKGRGVATTCINALRLEHYYLLVEAAGEVEVDARCEGCPLRRGGGVERALEAAKALEGRVKVRTGRAPPTQLVRRAALRLVVKAAGALAGAPIPGARGVVVEDRKGPEPAPAALRLRAVEAGERLGAPLERPLPVIDEAKCTFCGVCAGVCPARAIEFSEAGMLRVDLDSCISCGLCAEECPESAIEMRPSTARGRVTLYRRMRECPTCGYVYPADMGECPKCSTVKRMIVDFYSGRRFSCLDYVPGRWRGREGEEGAGRG
jgi:2-oxoacid:acceptor oxidoreductase delta subunit (pyruvate/2-ketoisovalerate family)